MATFDLLQNVQTARVGRVQIKKNNVDRLGVDQPKRLLGGLSRTGEVSESRCGLPAGFADEAVVIHDEQVEQCGTFTRRRIGRSKYARSNCGRHREIPQDWVRGSSVCGSD